MPEDLGLIFNAVIVDKKEKNKNIYNRMHPAQREHLGYNREVYRSCPRLTFNQNLYLDLERRARQD